MSLQKVCRCCFISRTLLCTSCRHTCRDLLHTLNNILTIICLIHLPNILQRGKLSLENKLEWILQISLYEEWKCQQLIFCPADRRARRWAGRTRWRSIRRRTCSVHRPRSAALCGRAAPPSRWTRCRGISRRRSTDDAAAWDVGLQRRSRCSCRSRVLATWASWWRSPVRRTRHHPRGRRWSGSSRRRRWCTCWCTGRARNTRTRRTTADPSRRPARRTVTAARLSDNIYVDYVILYTYI